MEGKESKYEGLKSQIKTASDYAFYAMQRLDLLLISLAGAGIFACWEVYKFYFILLGNTAKTSLIPIKTSAVLFLSTIILNFIGQWTSYKANVTRESSLEHELSELEHDHIGGHRDKIEKANRRNKRHNWIVKMSNGASIVTLITALGLLAAFICYFL